jgi:O-antigen ligase
VTLTGSRAGLVLTMAALALTLILLLPSYVTVRRYRKRIALGAVVAGLALIETWGGQVGQRVQSHGFADPGRLEMYRIALAMVADRPWLGHGAGSFEAAFPPYRGEALGMFGVWDIAHSTPLEIAVEWGVPVLVVLCALWGAAIVSLWRVCRNRGRGRDRSVVVAALSVGGLGTLHSMVDFSLQIPGYAVVFAAIVGCGLGRSRRLSVDRPAPGQPPVPARVGAEAPSAAPA